VVVDELQAGDRLTAELASEIRLLAADAERRQHMSEAMRSLARPDAAELIADRCTEILCGAPVRMAA
jgi:UDP-N-acetylglucosamine:LPS N-acetylglucosamine transferase